ncbi:MAG: DNA-binding protein [Arsenophonus sp. NEOnobi-MAG3]
MSKTGRGYKGKAVEYHVNSLPEDVFNILSLNDNFIDYLEK